VAVPAVWLPAGGTLTSPLPTPACAAAPAAASCPAGTWTSSPYPTCWTCTPATTGGTTRPAYNTGNGFYVLNGKLYDANGNPFIIRGVDRAHYDIAPNPGLALTHANAQRVLVETNYGASVASLVAGMTTNAINYKQVPIPVTTITPAGADTSCSSDPAVVAAAVANWVATASSWTTLNKYMLLNIANEWGPTNSTVWRDSNISAVTAMRKAGYLGTLVIDSGGCGQDINDLANYSAAVFAADPQKNIIFSLHEYGESLAKPGPTLAGVQARFATLGKLQTTVGAVYAVLEFGPGNGIGPSPTNITPAQIVAAAEANGLGWAAWAWDDNDLANCMGDNNWFDMQINACTGYTGLASQLTLFGQAMLPFLAIAQPATIFATTTNASVKAASPKLRHP
jgi:mannan endo-1,4-beta-mannosidase